MSRPMILLVGILAGCIICLVLLKVLFGKRNNHKTVGTLQIIEANGEEPYMFLSLETDIASFIHDPEILLKVTYKKASHE